MSKVVFKLQQLLQAASVYRKPRPKQYCSSKRLRRQEENKEQKKNENPRRRDKKKGKQRKKLGKHPPHCVRDPARGRSETLRSQRGFYVTGGRPT